MTTKIPTSMLDTAQGYPAGDGSALTNLLPFLHVREEQPSGTAGGANATGWIQRTLNTVKTNEITGASLAGSQITLPAGTYYAEASAPGHIVGQHQTRLRNSTDSTTLLVGESEYSNSGTGGSQTRASVFGRFTITGSKIIQLDHFTTVVHGTDGFGVCVSSGEVEVYAEVKIWKIA